MKLSKEQFQKLSEKYKRYFILIDKNNHPTVKPTSLMKYLCRLITPVNGIVFDPFSGSGSTGNAAILEDFSFIGSELESDYADIANARIDHAMTNKMLLNDKYETIVNKVIPIEPENPFF